MEELIVMNILSKRRILTIPAAVALMALAAPVAPVQAQDEDSWVSNMWSTSMPALTSGDYAWLADLSQPAPALLSVSDYGTYYDQVDGQDKPVPPPGTTQPKR